MKKTHWRLLGLLLLLLGIGAVIGVVLRRLMREKKRELPPPDRVIGPKAPPEPVVPVVTEEVAEEVADSQIEEQDAPPPPPERPVILAGPEISFAPGMSTEDTEKLWSLLQQETYRIRGEGFHKDWAFHIYATQENLGAPLSQTASKEDRVEYGGKQYGFQVFARDTLFNEVPKWGEISSLNTLLEGKMPETDGLGRRLLEATYRAAGQELHTDWAFHKVALEQQLGPALGDPHRITVDGQEYSLQVFASDTLYTPVPNWQDVRRLSETGPGSLAEALWKEAYAFAGSPYDANSGFHKLAVKNKAGSPLSGIFTVDMGGALFNTQVYAKATIYSDLEGDNVPRLQSELFQPTLPDIDLVAVQAPEPGVGEPGDAMSDKRPVFALLPVAGKPRISQFYGYTKFAAGKGRAYYGACQGRHPGIDFAVPEGTPLLAIAHGLVVCAGVANKDCPFGGSPPQIAIVRYGSVYAIYGHASKVNVRKGQLVKPGDVVCWSGTYGGPHLHFEIRPVPKNLLSNTDTNQKGVNPGFAVNPVEYFSNELQEYFQQCLAKLGGTSHFCVGTFHDQEQIRFGGPVDNRPCTN
jgi:murein DD-endopeptidase MepM/ murein hydrolase activator NlpD